MTEMKESLVQETSPFGAAKVDLMLLKIEAQDLKGKIKSFEVKKRKFILNLEKRLLVLIPKEKNSLLEVFEMSGIKFSGPPENSMLSNLLIDMFLLENEIMSLSKENSIIFCEVLSFNDFTKNEIDEKLKELNSFWSKECILTFHSNGSFHQFTLTRLV